MLALGVVLLQYINVIDNTYQHYWQSLRKSLTNVSRIIMIVT